MKTLVLVITLATFCKYASTQILIPHYKVSDNKWGMCDTSGKTVIPHQYNAVELYDWNKNISAKVHKNNKEAFLSKQGKEVTNFYEHINEFDDNDFYIISVGKKCGVERNKKILVNPEWDMIMSPYFMENKVTGPSKNKVMVGRVKKFYILDIVTKKINLLKSNTLKYTPPVIIDDKFISQEYFKTNTFFDSLITYNSLKWENYKIIDSFYQRKTKTIILEYTIEKRKGIAIWNSANTSKLTDLYNHRFKSIDYIKVDENSFFAKLYIEGTYGYTIYSFHRDMYIGEDCEDLDLEKTFMLVGKTFSIFKEQKGGITTFYGENGLKYEEY